MKIQTESRRNMAPSELTVEPATHRISTNRNQTWGINVQTVEFINMADGTKAEYEFLDGLEKEYVAGLPGRMMRALARQGEDSIGGYKITRLDHALQSATRALRDGRDNEYVVAALIHDIGDELAPYSHSEMAAAILRPYVSDKIYWIVKHHGLFQMFYYAHHFGGDRHARDKFKDHQWYEETVEFCEKYDQNCFDPDYDSKPLSFFEPMVNDVLGTMPNFNREALV